MSTEVRVATFNVRYGTAPDGVNGWRHRRGAVLAQLRALDFDVCGLQEVLTDQRDFLAGALAGCRWYGVGRTDGDRDGEQSPIAVRGARILVEDWSTLWLSEQPQTIGSRGWDAKIPRVATVLYGTLAGVPVGVVNTHLDHRGRLAQVSSARLLAGLVRGDLQPGPVRERRSAGPGTGTAGAGTDAGASGTGGAVSGAGTAGSETGAWTGSASRRGGWLGVTLGRDGRRAAPFGTGLRRLRKIPPAAREPEADRRWIVMGDFNVELGSPAMNELTRRGLRSVLPEDAGGTFHGWSGATDRQRIDHILVDDGWEVVRSGIVHDRPGGTLPSDHWPISAQLRLR